VLSLRVPEPKVRIRRCFRILRRSRRRRQRRRQRRRSCRRPIYDNELVLAARRRLNIQLNLMLLLLGGRRSGDHLLSDRQMRALAQPRTEDNVNARGVEFVEEVVSSIVGGWIGFHFDREIEELVSERVGLPEGAEGGHGWCVGGRLSRRRMWGLAVVKGWERVG
jgi:hypothetical protein